MVRGVGFDIGLVVTSNCSCTLCREKFVEKLNFLKIKDLMVKIFLILFKNQVCLV